MNATQRHNLQKMGGRVTTVTEFLGLKPGEEKLIDLQIDLTKVVKARRIAKGLTQSELARALGTTQPYIARLESAGASTDLLLRALFVLGASQQEIANAIAAPGERAAPAKTVRSSAPKRQTTKPRRTKSQPRVLANAS